MAINSNRWGSGSRAFERWMGNPWEAGEGSGKNLQTPQQQEPWPEELNTGKDHPLLSAQEKALIFEYNKVRSDPERYAREQLIPKKKIYSGNNITIAGKWVRKTVEGIKCLESCIENVMYHAKTGPYSILYPMDGFIEVARLHAEDQSKNGGIGHVGSDGRSEGTRILSITEQIPFEDYQARENIDYGPWENFPSWTLFVLLLDDGIPTRTHRSNIFLWKANQIGVAIRPHPNKTLVSIQEIGLGMRKKGQ
jgi:hypothetical protein